MQSTSTDINNSVICRLNCYSNVLVVKHQSQNCHLTGPWFNSNLAGLASKY